MIYFINVDYTPFGVKEKNINHIKTKRMKRLKSIILSIFLPVLTIGQTYNVVELSTDPKAHNFCMYFNDVLDVQSFRVDEKDIAKVFNYEDHVDRLDNDYIWFALHPTYYKLWIPEDSILFIVKLPKNRKEILGEHLLFFISILRMNCQHKDYELWRKEKSY